MSIENPMLPIQGKDTRAVIFIGGVRQDVTDAVKSWAIDEKGKIHHDKYIGRDRDRLDKQVDYYDLKLEIDYTNSVLIQALLTQQAAIDARTPFLTISVGIISAEREGGTHGWLITNCFALFKLSMKGKDERGMSEFPFEGENIKYLSL